VKQLIIKLQKGMCTQLNTNKSFKSDLTSHLNLQLLSLSLSVCSDALTFDDISMLCSQMCQF